IGYVGMGFRNWQGGFPGIYDANVDGVQPTSASITDETYPLRRGLHMITPKFNKTVRIDQYAYSVRFINYILSPGGQSLVAQTAFVPLPNARSVPGYDVNLDGTADVLDQVRIGQGAWTAPPVGVGHDGWIREDANSDSWINVSDIAAVATNWHLQWA